MISTWPCPPSSDEYALIVDQGRATRILIIPPLFDESNKMRRFCAELMRLINRSGADSIMPDLPGQNESLAPLANQTLSDWRKAAKDCARWFGASHVLTLRAGAVLAPPDLAGWCYAPQAGQSALRALLRARIISAKEAGRTETRDALMEQGTQHGLELAGYALGPEMIAQLAGCDLAPSHLKTIVQSDLGGAGLWLRAEPGHDPAQAARLCAIISSQMT